MYVFMFFVSAYILLQVLSKKPDPDIEPEEEPEKEPDIDTLVMYTDQMEQYANLNPELYEEFIENLQLFKNTFDELYLYKAIAKLEVLSLYAKDDELLYDIAQKIGTTGEIMANVSKPRYLKR